LIYFGPLIISSLYYYTVLLSIAQALSLPHFINAALLLHAISYSGFYCLKHVIKSQPGTSRTLLFTRLIVHAVCCSCGLLFMPSIVQRSQFLRTLFLPSFCSFRTLFFPPLYFCTQLVSSQNLFLAARYFLITSCNGSHLGIIVEIAIDFSLLLRNAVTHLPFT
jgi:hypothetical protein